MRIVWVDAADVTDAETIHRAQFSRVNHKPFFVQQLIERVEVKFEVGGVKRRGKVPFSSSVRIDWVEEAPVKKA